MLSSPIILLLQHHSVVYILQSSIILLKPTTESHLFLFLSARSLLHASAITLEIWAAAACLPACLSTLRGRGDVSGEGAGGAGRRAVGGASVWCFGWSGVTYLGATSWSVCSLGGGEGDCSVVSLNKMAARPLSTRAHWTPTMTVRSAVGITTECISPESLLTLHSR